jgi:formate dehydrogenase
MVKVLVVSDGSWFYFSIIADDWFGSQILYKGGEHAIQQPKLLGTVENALGLIPYCKEKGWELVVTDDKEGPNSVAQKNLLDADVVISSPFFPMYVTKELMKTAKNLKVSPPHIPIFPTSDWRRCPQIAITAGVGSDHVDLDAANAHKITVAEVTGSNVVSFVPPLPSPATATDALHV